MRNSISWTLSIALCLGACGGDRSRPNDSGLDADVDVGESDGAIDADHIDALGDGDVDEPGDASDADDDGEIESIDGCVVPDPDDIERFPDCPPGGGIFGEWIVDDAGLPAFLYTFDQLRDERGAWPNSEDIAPLFRERRDHFTVTGNRRLNMMAVDDGTAVLFCNERGPTWLNRFDEEGRNLAGGFSYLHDRGSGEVLATAYRYAPVDAATRRVFGIGYYETETAQVGLRVRHRITAPEGDDPLVIDDVEIENLGTDPRSIAHFEYWDVNRHQLMTQWIRTGLAAGPGDAERDALNESFVQEVTFDAASAALVASMTPAPGEHPPARQEISAVDWYPPPVFLALLDGDVDQVIGDQGAFFGTGTPSAPEAVESPTDSDVLLPSTGAGGQPACLVMRTDLDLEPGETRSLRFAYGYLPDGSDLGMLSRYRDGDVWSESANRWREQLAYAALPDSPLAHRETAWRSHLLLAHTVWNDYYQQRYTPQGSAYLYIHGADGAARDQSLYAPATTYLDPALARGNLRLVMEITRSSDGEISYAFTGYGVLEGATLHEHPSDLDLYFFLGLSEYLSATGDRDFLDGDVPFHPRDGGLPATVTDDSVLDHVRNAFAHLRDDVGLGPNGLVRIRDGDWSDGIVYEDLSPLAISFTIENGESVPNSQLAHYVLPLLAAQLEDRDPALAEEMRVYAGELEEPIRETFGTRWFGRAWLRNTLDQAYLKGNDLESDPFAANYIDLEAQPWGLLDGVLDEAERETLLDEVVARLDDDSPIGPRMRPGGDVWPAISQLMTWAYARYRPALAWASLVEHLYATHAREWPEQWIGVWSGPDGFQSAGTDGGTWASPVTPMTDFPVSNMNPEAMWLLGLIRTAGIEPVADGLLFTPRQGGPATYTVQLPLLRLDVAESGVSGWYRAQNDGELGLYVAVPEGALPTALVDGDAVAVTVDQGRVRLPLSLADGREIRFDVTW